MNENWIVTGYEGNKVRIVSSNKINAKVPMGQYLTIDKSPKVKHVLRVETSTQMSLFEPAPLIVDADLPILKQDQVCKNVILAEEIRQFPIGDDGLYKFIRPNDRARRTTQEEINEVFNLKEEGMPIFLATAFLGQNSILKDDNKNLIAVKLDPSFLYYQTMIAGQTGSGKTVAMKYLIEQFLEKEKGAVLAINVKSDDLLTLDKATEISDKKIEKEVEQEWKALNLKPKGIDRLKIFVPYSSDRVKKTVSKDKVSRITIKTEELEPNSLLGLLQLMPDTRAAEILPNVFRHWQEKYTEGPRTFINFIRWFKERATKDNSYIFPTLSQTGESDDIPLHPSTCKAILRTLQSSIDYFDREDSIRINEKHIMVKEQVSVIDVSYKDYTVFGSVLLRHLISKIYDAKSVKKEFSDVPVLIVIDEVHNFYGHESSKNALGELNAISRMGRSDKIGVIFASQNPEDLPPGITSIVNTRIFFRSLGNVSQKFGIGKTGYEVSALETGYAVISSFAVPQLKLIKFPLSLSGVKI